MGFSDLQVMGLGMREPTRERPHALAGFQAQLAAQVGLHTVYSWLNSSLHRELLAFADLLEW